MVLAIYRIHNYKILLIEDDADIREILKNFLTIENYEVTCAADGQEACELFDADLFSLIQLDWMIPKISGMDVMQYIRKTSVVPVIVMSAKDAETDKTLGLGLDADDYITTPFSIAEVLVRVKTNIRRASQYGNASATSAVLTAGNLAMDLTSYTLTKRGERVDLTAKEFLILKLLLQNPKRVYTKEQIYYFVWNDAYCGGENAVNIHINRLRSKIEDDTRNPRYMVTVWGIGYKLGGIL